MDDINNMYEIIRKDYPALWFYGSIRGHAKDGVVFKAEIKYHNIWKPEQKYTPEYILETHNKLQ